MRNLKQMTKQELANELVKRGILDKESASNSSMQELIHIANQRNIGTRRLETPPRRPETPPRRPETPPLRPETPPRVRPKTAEEIIEELKRMDAYPNRDIPEGHLKLEDLKKAAAGNIELERPVTPVGVRMRPKTTQEMINDIRAQYNGAPFPVANPTDKLVARMANELKIPMQRPDTPLRMEHRGRPAKTLEEMNSILSKEGWPPQKTIAAAQDKINKYASDNNIYEPFYSYANADARSGVGAGAGAGAGAGGGLYEHMTARPRDVRANSPTALNLRRSLADIETGSSDPAFTQKISSPNLYERGRAYTARQPRQSKADEKLRAMTPRTRRTEEENTSTFLPPNPEKASAIHQAQVMHALEEQKRLGEPGHQKAMEDTFRKGAEATLSADTVASESLPRWLQNSLQHYTKGAFEAAQQGPFIPQGGLIVDPSQLEKEARKRVKEASPFSKEAQERTKALNGILRNYAQDKTATEATQPYLNRLSQNPAKMHNELMGNTERDFNKAILDQSTREFNEKILPGIHAKYQTPGLRQHGHMGKDIGEAAEKHGRGVSQKLAEAGIGMRQMTLGAANAYGTNQAHAAGISGKTAIQDRENNLNATAEIEKLHRARNIEEREHVKDLERMGGVDRETAQRLRDAENAQAKMIHEHPRTMINFIGHHIKGQPEQRLKTETGIGPVRPHHTQGQTWSAASEALSDLGGRMFPQQRKKGGRIKRADGGPVTLQDAVQNAVIDRRDPISELRQMIYHAQGVNALQGRQPLKIGGSVDPIKSGAEDAHMYAGHAAMKRKLERMRNPSFASSLASATNLDEKTPGWLANSMRAFHRGYASNQQNINSADDLEYQLQSKLEDKAERERRLANEEQHVAAQIAHLRAQDAKSVLEGQKIQHEMRGSQQPSYSARELVGETLDEDETPVETTSNIKQPAGVAPKVIAPKVIAPKGTAPVVIAPKAIAPEGVAPEGVAPVVIAPEGVAPEDVLSEDVALEGVAPKVIAPEGVAQKATAQKAKPIPMMYSVKHDAADKKIINDSKSDFRRAHNLANSALDAGDAFAKVEGNQVLGGINSIFGNTAASVAGKIIGNKGEAEDYREAQVLSDGVVGQLLEAGKTPGRLKAVADKFIESKPSVRNPQTLNVRQNLKFAKEAKSTMVDELQDMIDANANPRVIHEQIAIIKKLQKRIKLYETKHANLLSDKKPKKQTAGDKLAYMKAEQKIANQSTEELISRYKGG
jgi:hypothetical protein